MSSEVLAIPQLITERGELTERLASVEPLRWGFELHEAGDFEDEPEFVARHRKTATEIVALPCPTPDAWQVVEADADAFDGNGFRHFDGLYSQYYQFHHTHGAIPKDEGSREARIEYATFSRILLELFSLTSAEHEAIHTIASGYDYPDGNTPIAFQPEGPNGRFAVPNGTITRPPNKRAQLLLSPNSSLVFPNGYNARPHSQPGNLLVHTFRSVDGAGTQLSLKRRVTAIRFH